MTFTLPATPLEWLVPGLIYLARICDVSIGTLRIISVARGHRFRAVLLGFVEILIWLAAISQILTHLNQIANIIAYALGFSTGIFVGMWLEQRVPLGNQLVRVVTSPDAARKLAGVLVATGFGMTHVNAEGGFGPVSILFTIVARSRAGEVVALLREQDPNAFYTIEDIRSVGGPAGALYYGTEPKRRPVFSFLGWRKSK